MKQNKPFSAQLFFWKFICLALAVILTGMLAMTGAMAGIRTTTMYLTAEELGKKRPENVMWVLSGCFGYSIITSGAVAAALYQFAPVVAERWIGDGCGSLKQEIMEREHRICLWNAWTPLKKLIN